MIQGVLHQTTRWFTPFSARTRWSTINRMIVTLDGPAGAGKSTVARALAERLGFRFLDTGAMYRAVALAGVKRGLDWALPQLLVDVARKIVIEFRGQRVFLDGDDVTEAIRTSEVTGLTHYAADNPGVRGSWLSNSANLPAMTTW